MKDSTRGLRSRLERLEKETPKPSIGDPAFALYRLALADAEEPEAGILASSTHPFAVAYRQAVEQVKQDALHDAPRRNGLVEIEQNADEPFTTPIDKEDSDNEPVR